MQARTFFIRLGQEHRESDEARLNAFLQHATIKRMATQLVQGPSPYWSLLIFFDNAEAMPPKPFGSPMNEAKPLDRTAKIGFAADAPLSPEEQDIVAALRAWRQAKAAQLAVPHYVVCANADLVTLAKARPRSLEDMAQLRGFGPQKIAKLGRELLDVLADY